MLQRRTGVFTGYRSWPSNDQPAQPHASSSARLLFSGHSVAVEYSLAPGAGGYGTDTGASAVEAFTYKLEQILTPERRYIIPTFQRDYEWTENGQWQLLFEDLDAVAGRLWQAREHAKVMGTSPLSAEKRLSPHFLGAVVCDQLPSPAGGIDLRAVIDGQQRLTTLQLMVRGVLDVLIERGSPRVNKVRRLLQNPTDVVSAEHEVHKLWPRRKDRDVWPVAMADTLPAQDDHLYLKARTYFADAVRQAAGEGQTGRLVDFVDALVGMFKLVVIDLDENDDAQVIFEVLNGRQTPLSASDLVKKPAIPSR